jgi:hypothetical protein
MGLVASVAFGAMADSPKKVLVVSVTKGFRHDVIPAVNELMKEFSASSGAFTADFAGTDEEIAAKMTLASLAAYDGVVFNNTSGDLPLPDRERVPELDQIGQRVCWISCGDRHAGQLSAVHRDDWRPISHAS